MTDHNEPTDAELDAIGTEAVIAARGFTFAEINAASDRALWRAGWSAALEAKTQPTREQIIDAMIGVRGANDSSAPLFGNNDYDRADAGALADAVLALFDPDVD